NEANAVPKAFYPAFTADSPPTSATVGAIYGPYPFVARGHPTPTYRVSSGTLPPGLTLGTKTGVLSGTPESARRYTFELTATNSAGSTASSPITITVVSPTPIPYSPVPPTRICDTRPSNPSHLSGEAAQCNGHTIRAKRTLTVKVAGEGFGVPAGAKAVVMNVTVVNPAGPGYLTLWPSGEPRPRASDVNYTSGEVTANLTEVGLGHGEIDIYSLERTGVVVDVEGYVAPTASGGAGSGLYQPLSHPVRICDTRSGNPSGLSGNAAQCSGKALRAGGTLGLAVAGEGFGVPAGAEAVVANLTVVGPAAAGYLTVWPDGAARPTASNVNYLTGQTVPNRIIVNIGSDGELDIYSLAAANVIVDISGYYTAPGGSGTSFVPEAAPVRICDTRAGNPSGLSGPAAQCNGASDKGEALGPGASITVKVAGKFFVPPGATAAVLNVTAVDPSRPSYLEVWPSGNRPVSSDLNPAKGDTEANMVVATLSGSGTVRIYNNSGTVDVVVDLAGWYQTPPPTPGTDTLSASLSIRQATAAAGLALPALTPPLARVAYFPWSGAENGVASGSRCKRRQRCGEEPPQSAFTPAAGRNRKRFSGKATGPQAPRSRPGG
ncbi:MAG: Ig domain-containing protein, partial [Acidimicrobiales bacterium]